jgi:hypothetical protein
VLNAKRFQLGLHRVNLHRPAFTRTYIAPSGGVAVDSPLI